jgi:hypothetical protein
MKNEANELEPAADTDMRDEYELTNGVRGKHYKAMLGDYTITVHQADGSKIVREVELREEVAECLRKSIAAIETVEKTFSAEEVAAKLGLD